MSKKRQFRWQINASAVGSLLGHFGDDRRKKALAECWLMNIKRMQRFGAVPAEVVSQETTAEIVQKEMAQKPEYAKHIQNGIQDSQKQKEAVAHIKKTAVEQVTNAKRKHDDMQQIVEEIKKINIIQQYTTKKSGTKRSKIGSFFSVNDKLYHKTSRKTSTLSDYKTAAAHGYQTLQAKETAHHEKETEQRQAANSLKRAKIVNENIIKQATKTINTTRGTIRESTDLELVQKRFPNCAPGNDKAYFMNLSSSSGYSGFVIGKIDGQSPGIIFELKHRQARLFEQLRRYEQVQVMLYMKMTRCPHAMLVETYKGKQNYFELKLSHGGLCHFRAEGGNWQRGMQFSGIKEGLEQAIEMLNTAEKDPTFRKELKKHLF